MQRELRKLQNELSVNGRGVIILGAWDFVKVFLYIFFASGYVYALFEMDNNIAPYAVYAIIWAIMVFISFLIRFYVGRRAILEARGERVNKKLYLLLAGFICSTNVFSIAGIFIKPSGLDDIFSAASTLLLETASAINFISLIRSALKLRAYRAAVTREADCNAA